MTTIEGTVTIPLSEYEAMQWQLRRHEEAQAHAPISSTQPRASAFDRALHEMRKLNARLLGEHTLLLAQRDLELARWGAKRTEEQLASLRAMLSDSDPISARGTF